MHENLQKKKMVICRYAKDILLKVKVRKKMNTYKAIINYNSVRKRLKKKV